MIADKKQLERLLTTGKARLEVEGVVEINKRNNTATIKSWPPGKRFQTFLNKFEKELSDGMIGFTDLSVEETTIVFQVIRERNRDKIFDQFVEKLMEVSKGFISFELIVVDQNRKVLTKSVDQMLLDTYESFKRSNETMLHYEVEKIDNTVIEYQTLMKIRPTLTKCIGKKMKVDEILTEIENKTGVPQDVSKGLISKYKISKLLTIDTDTSDLNNSKKELQHHISTLNEYVLEQYNEF